MRRLFVIAAPSFPPADRLQLVVVSVLSGNAQAMIQAWVGMWALRRAVRLLTADDPRPLGKRLTAEGKRIVMGAAITLALLIAAAIALVAVVIAAVS